MITYFTFLRNFFVLEFCLIVHLLGALFFNTYYTLTDKKYMFKNSILLITYVGRKFKVFWNSGDISSKTFFITFSMSLISSKWQPFKVGKI